MLLGGKRTNPLTWLDDDFTTASSSVYTYGPGEHAVERPAEDKPAASTLQTICASNLTNAQAMAVFSLAIQLQLVAMRLYWQNSAMPRWRIRTSRSAPSPRAMPRPCWTSCPP